MRRSSIHFYLLAAVSLFCNTARAADSTQVRAFIDNWKRTIAEEWVHCNYFELFYSDTVYFYGTPLPRNHMCVRVSESLPLDEVLLEPGYKVEATGTTGSWKVVFENPLNIYGIEQSHYIIVRETAGDSLAITTHSSAADDRWQVRRKAIASNVVKDSKGKTYYVLSEDSTTLHGRRLYFLTDTLAFTAPVMYNVCVDTLLSYDATATVFVAMSKKNNRAIESIHDISQELNAETFQEAQLMQGGFPCLIQKDSMDTNGMFVQQWSVPEIQWKKNGNDSAVIRLRCSYNYGDGCVRSYTTVYVLEKKKKIEVRKVMAPRPDGNGKH